MLVKSISSEEEAAMSSFPESTMVLTAEGRKKGRKEGRKGGRKVGRKCLVLLAQNQFIFQLATI